MKNILLFILILSSATAYSQVDSAKLKQSADSLTAAIRNQLNISETKTKLLLNILSDAKIKMDAVARNRQLQKPEKDSQIKAIADWRDKKIENILDRNQITQLQEIFVTIKQKKVAQTSANQ